MSIGVRTSYHIPKPCYCLSQTTPCCGRPPHVQGDGAQLQSDWTLVAIDYQATEESSQGQCPLTRELVALQPGVNSKHVGEEAGLCHVAQMYIG
jgi:hypothetical protein